MRSEPSNARSDGSEVRSTVQCTSLHSTNPNPKSSYQHPTIAWSGLLNNLHAKILKALIMLSHLPTYCSTSYI
ncbi:hypothetical protein RHMOL_Rhmol02G0025400 [Rhododendron molle]|uniref:Uncharacterized protein n=1 Tax=Rhododendron molle TaxID=49168 RepID=A0ACC0PN78_RHOML|nr:hypothetical protein RHMOL_Rhmol02G0025400 [Rhododendron molle]